MHGRAFIHLVLWLGFSLLLAMDAATAVQADENGSPTFEQRVLEIVNEERWLNGQLPPLKGTASLDSAAETHSDNMAARNFFDHCDFDTGTLPWHRMEAAGYINWSDAGENIAAGFGTPEAVMGGWMQSSGHRGNILSPDFREVGIGYTYESGDGSNVRTSDDDDCAPDSANSGPYYHYWTQNFGARSQVMPVIINREAYETTDRQVSLYQYGSGWAASMRFRNENSVWSSWQTFAPDANWTLSAGNGVKTVHAEISSGPGGTGTVRSASDTINLNEKITGPQLHVSPGALAYVVNPVTGTGNQMQTLTVSNEGNDVMTWNLSEEPAVNWLGAKPAGGTLDPGESTAVEVTVSVSGVSPGVYQAALIIEAGDADNSPQTAPVSLLYTDHPPVYLPIIQGP